MNRAGLIALVLTLVLGLAYLLDRFWLPGPDSRPPSFLGETPSFPAPRWLSAEQDGVQIRLRWWTVPGALAYTLWRSPDREGEMQAIYRGRNTVHVDESALASGQSWCYRLTATDPEFDESPFSEPRCLSRETADGE